MRILLASNVYPPNFVGGAELIAHHQAKALQALGHEVEVFAGETQAFGNHHEVRREVWAGIPVHRVSMLPGDYDPAYFNFSHPDIEARFQEVLDAFKPQVFHGHNLIGLSAALPHLARRAGATTVVTLHDHWGYCYKNTIIKEGTKVCTDFSRCFECLPAIDEGAGRAIPIRFRKDFVSLMMEDVDAFVSPSRYLAESYLKAGFPRDRMHVLWNGIDVDRFKGVRQKPGKGELRLTYVGILLPHKGVGTLLEALGHLPADAPVRVNLAGGGESRPEYEAMLERNGRKDKVTFWGKVDHDRIGEVYANTDVLVLPSIWPENQPVSITEAMGCGIPSIVSNMGGMLELVEDGTSGDVFEAGNARDLAGRIQRYLDDPGRAQRLGRAARERISRNSFRSQVQRLLEIYRDAAARPDAAAPGKLAVCVGHRVGAEAAAAAEVLGRDHGWRFVMSEWLPQGWSRRSLTWIADPETPWSQVAGAMASEAPVIVDVRSREARRRVSTSGASLFYYRSEQAVRAVCEIEGQEGLGSEISRRARDRFDFQT